jgi:hypothetical protein
MPLALRDLIEMVFYHEVSSNIVGHPPRGHHSVLCHPPCGHHNALYARDDWFKIKIRVKLDVGFELSTILSTVEIDGSRRKDALSPSRYNRSSNNVVKGSHCEVGIINPNSYREE